MNSQKKYINISYIGNKLSKNINYKKTEIKNASKISQASLMTEFDVLSKWMNTHTHTPLNSKESIYRNCT